MNSEIYIQRHGEQLGPPYSVEEAKSYLADGLLHPDDMAWCEGMAEWAPLANVLPVAESQLVTEAPPPGLLQPPPKVTTSELGASCFDLAVGFQESYTRLIQELPRVDNEGQNLNYGQVWIELICLGIFAVQHAVQETLKTGPKDAMLDAYHNHLKQLRIDGVPDVFELMSKRFMIYENSVHARHPHGIAWNVGETFAIFCGAELSTRLVMTGSTLFNDIFGYVVRWIDEIGVENITTD